MATLLRSNAFNLIVISPIFLDKDIIVSVEKKMAS